ncbi:MAG: hypothetical protein Kow00109_19300 [Acidobacteriota bacterium]
MAELLCKEMIRELGLPVEWVESAGTLGIEGQPPPAHVATVLREVGLEIGVHRSQGLAARHLDEADFLVAMAPEHVREIRMRRPGAEERVVRLWEYSGKGRKLDEIADPIGGDLATYRQCRDDIRECLANWLRTLAGNSAYK